MSQSKPKRGFRAKVAHTLDKALGAVQSTTPSPKTSSKLHDIERSFVQADIELYLKEELASLSRFEVERLADKSGGLFIYVAMVVRYIQAGEATGDFDEHLSAMLSVGSASRGDGKNVGIDRLYMTVLLAADEKMIKRGTKERMRHVLWTVICAREPLRIDTLALLADIDLNKAKAMLRQLHSVLYQHEQRGVISAYMPRYRLHTRSIPLCDLLLRHETT